MNLLNRYIYIIGIGVVAFLSSCGSDADPVPSRVGEPISMAADVASATEWRVGSRAEGDVVAAVQPETIGVFSMNDYRPAPVFENQKMDYRYGTEILADGWSDAGWPDDNVWVYNPTQTWIRANYKFYAYSPYTADASLSVMAYAMMSQFTLPGVPGASPVDYMVGKRVIDYDNTNLRNGFTTPAHTMRDYPTVQMQHLMGRVRFCFKIGSEYHKVRNIHVKELVVSNVTYATYNCVVNLATGEPTVSIDGIYVTDPITLLAEYDPQPVAGHETHPGMLLTEDYDLMTSLYVLPQTTISSMTLTATYDVYDLAGMITRADCQATTVVTPSFSIQAGYYYDILLVVEPDFLYVLSDNDFDIDGYFTVN